MRKTLSVILTLLLCAGLAIPASALDAAIPAAVGGYEVIDASAETTRSDKELAAVGAQAPAPTALSAAVPLSGDLLQYGSYSRTAADNPDVIPCDANNCLYFISGSSVKRLSLDTREQTEAAALPFNSAIDRYNAGDKLYYLYSVWSRTATTYYIVAFNLLTQEVEEPVALPEGYRYYALGVDSLCRYYLYAVDADSNKQLLLVQDGAVVSSAPVENTVYSFIGFDKNNGNFYTLGYMNWVYWGYDHNVNVIYPGNVTDNTLTYTERNIDMLSQRYYNDRCRQAEYFDNKYLAVDATIYSSYRVYAMDDFALSGTTVHRSFSALRDEEFQSKAAIGTRSAYIGHDSMVVCQNSTDLIEYSMLTGDEICRMTADHPVFMLMTCRDAVIAIERADDQFYYQQFAWAAPTAITVTPPQPVMKTGDTLSLTASFDSDAAPSVRWESDDPKVVSVNADGELYAWNAGTATVTVTTMSGLSAQVRVIVSDTRDRSVSPYQQTAFSQTAANNLSRNNYSTWSKVMNSYIAENADRTLTCVGFKDGKVYLDTYSADGTTPLSRKTVDAELPLFGGFYSGEKYNFLVFGANNSECSDDVEVVRIVRYSKSWERTGSVSVKGANTYKPFDAGSLRMTETDGKLYVYTCHEMYTTSDGLNHQANMIFVVDEAQCSLLEQLSEVSNYTYTGYVSHSFNQFIQTDGERIYRADHGDAHPRGLAVFSSEVSDSVTDIRYAVPLQFGESSGHYNSTGASIGGMELSKNNILFVGNMDSDLSDSDNTRKIFLTVMNKNILLRESFSIWLDDAPESGVTVGTPQLVKIGEDQFLVMWEESSYDSANYKYNYTTKLLTIDSEGNRTSDVVSRELRLSDCQPIFCSDRLVRWYTCDSKTTTLYTLDPFRIGESEDMFMLGDVDQDGVVTIVDASYIQRVNALVEVDIDEDILYRNGDIDGSGNIEIIDVTYIQRFLAFMDTDYPIGKYTA